MTAGYGWGMLVIGFAAILIGGLIAFFIINKVIKEEKDEQEKSDS